MLAMKILVTWIGTQDLNAAAGENHRGQGPVASALATCEYDRVLLLANQSQEALDGYAEWAIALGQLKESAVEKQFIELDSPTDYGAIYKGVDRAVGDILEKYRDEEPELTFHLSPGTNQMATIWILLSTSKYPATLIQSSPEAGVETAALPFEIAAELVSKMLDSADQALTRANSTLAGGSLGDFPYESPAMIRLMAKAQKAAQRSVPVLIEGEPGTEKALLAKAIHDGSKRTEGRFEKVNCGASSREEALNLLFGQPDDQMAGALRRARNGTLYIEEIERLSEEGQARLQRYLEDQGDDAPRFIISSRSNLLEQVRNGDFREELFYALAVIVLKIPPLRERSGDMSRLLDHVVARINEESRGEPEFMPKRLSPAAKSFLLQQRWPGNVHELENTLRRALIWSDEEEISEAAIWDSLLIPAVGGESEQTILGRPIEDGIDIQALISEVVRHYISRAIEYSEGNKSQAAKLIGLPSYQTLTNWMKKYDL
jgi:DNA-binding NtrC family response regulator